MIWLIGFMYILSLFLWFIFYAGTSQGNAVEKYNCTRWFAIWQIWFIIAVVAYFMVDNILTRVYA